MAYVSAAAVGTPRRASGPKRWLGNSLDNLMGDLVHRTILWLATLGLTVGACGGDAPSTGITTASGLTITHITEGSGPSPTASDVVQVHYHGTFPDGKVFDSSVERGQPASFPLSRVIPCWTEGVALMKVGGKALLVCPPEVAYGANGAPPRIPPNATLHFEVELLAIQ